MNDLLGLPYTKEMSYDPNSGLIKHKLDYIREDGVHIKETNVAVLNYRYSDNHWIIYRPNIKGKMAVCIQFEGRYYLLAQTPRTLDRIFTFLETETLKGKCGNGKIKKWNIRYPSKNEKVSDWLLMNNSPIIYSHHDFTCMLTWYLNNLWLFDGSGLTPKNKELAIPLNKNPPINDNLLFNNNDLLEWKEQISIVNDQYKSSVKVIMDPLVVIEVKYLSKINGKKCVIFQYFNFRESAGSSSKFHEKNSDKMVEWSGSKNITRFNHVKNMLKILTNEDKSMKTNLRGLLYECMGNKYAPLPKNYHCNQEYEERKQLQKDQKNWVKNIQLVNKEILNKIQTYYFLKHSDKGTPYQKVIICHNDTGKWINCRNLDQPLRFSDVQIRKFTEGDDKCSYTKVTLPKNYVYTNTKEQLYKLCNNPYDIIATYNIDF
jgi:hypothetical protein